MTEKNTQPAVEAALDNVNTEGKDTEVNSETTDFENTPNESGDTVSTDEKTYTEAEHQRKLNSAVKKRLHNERMRNEQMVMGKLTEMETKIAGISGQEAVTNVDPSVDAQYGQAANPPDMQQQVTQAVVNLAGKVQKEREQQEVAAREAAFLAHQQKMVDEHEDYLTVVEQDINPLIARNPNLLNIACEQADGSEMLYKIAKLYPKELKELALSNDVKKLRWELPVLAEKIKEHDRAVSSKKSTTPDTIRPSSGNGGAVKVGEQSSSDLYNSILDDYK